MIPSVPSSSSCEQKNQRARSQRTLSPTIFAVAYVTLLLIEGRSLLAQQTSTSPKVEQKASLRASSPSSQNVLKAEQLYLAGARLVERKQLTEAQSNFARAAALDPSRADYVIASNLIRDHQVRDLIQQAAQARFSQHIELADRLLAQAHAIDPQNELVLQHQLDPPLPKQTQIMSSGEVAFASAIEITPKPGLRDLHVRGDVREVVTQVADQYGLVTIFDDSVLAQNLRFDLEQSSYAEAMPILLRMAHTFAIPVDAKTLLVAKDTQENREKFERVLEETVYVPGSTTEQLNELSNIVKNVFDVKQIFVSPTSGTVLLRAPASVLKALNYTLADLLDGGAELTLDLKLASVDKSRTRDTGVNTPTSIGAFSVAAQAQQIVSANQAIVDQAISSGAFVPTGNAANDVIQEALFLILSGVASDAKVSNLVATAGHGQTLTGIYLGSGATINLGLNSSEARALDDISVRVGDRQTTTLRVGSKYPITTSTYSSGLSGSTAALLNGKTIGGVPVTALAQQLLGSAQTVPLIQYEDLGLTLKTTPAILRSGLISMHIDLKIEALTGVSANDIPVLTNRAFTSDITLQEGVTAVMLSELSTSEAASVNGLPGLAELPGFRQTAANELRAVASSELVLLITPHLVRRRSNNIAGPRIAFTPSVPQDN